MTETTDRKPRRSAKEIAQANADKAVAALAKHDEKEAKLQAKVDKAQKELDVLAEKREQLVAEADYRQMHPLLREETAGPEQPQLEAEQQDDNPFA